MTPASLLLLLQLADGSFPSGGFAHSGGLEAANALRRGTSASGFLRESLVQAGRSQLPFVREACASPSRFAELDRAFDATCLGHVTSRASRAQGRALATAAARIWDEDPRVLALAAHARSDSPCHHPPVFGALFGLLGLDPPATMAAFLHATARSGVSAAVRLGICGPLEAQQLQLEAAGLADHLLATCSRLGVDDVAQASPLLEIYASLHDQLDGRLFQS